MFTKARTYLAILALCSLAGTASAGVPVTYFGDGPFGDVSDLLDSVGIGSGNIGSETTATTFMVAGAASDSVNLTFTFERDTGSFLATFGFFDASAVTANPVTQQRVYATQALTAATTVFDDVTQNPGATGMFTVGGGTKLGFFLIPNDTVANVLADVDAFYDSPANSDDFFTNNRSPLFSEQDANPGELDQMLSFIGNGVTLFTFEDLTRIPSGNSDEDFTDLAFTIDTELIPEPTSLIVWTVLGISGVRMGRRRRRR